MATKVERYQQLQAEVVAYRDKAAKAAGALEELKKTLAEEFQVLTLKEARRLLESMEEELATLETAFAKDLAAFEAEFGEMLHVYG